MGCTKSRTSEIIQPEIDSSKRNQNLETPKPAIEESDQEKQKAEKVSEKKEEKNDKVDDLNKKNISQQQSETNQKELSIKQEEFILEQKDLIGQKTEKFKNNYIFIKQLGKGSFAEVRKAQHKYNKKLYANAFDINQQNDILSEIEILKNVDHPNIVKIYEYYNENDYFYIVTEYCSGGELFDRKINIDDKNIATIAKKVLRAINYCHKKNITHRDLKPQNILYQTHDSGSEIKIVDWGFSSFFNETTVFTKLIGTPLYMAPEIVDKQFNEKCDIWAIGMMLFMLIIEKHPFIDGCKNIGDLLLKTKQASKKIIQQLL